MRKLNPRRRHRTYPRAVKRTRHNHYRARRPRDHGTRHDRPPTIKLANLGATGDAKYANKINTS